MPMPPAEPLCALSAERCAVRRRRWPWVVVATTGALVVSGILLAPRIVGSVLRTRLLQLGLDAVDIGAIDVGLGSLEVRDLRLASATDDGSFSIRSATATFGIGDLLGGRLATLVLDAPLWTLAKRGGASPFRRALGEGAGTAEAGRLPSVPVRHLTIRDGRILVAADDAPQAVTVDMVSTFGEPAWQVQLDTTWRGQAVHATAQLQQQAGRALGTLHLATVGGRPIACSGSLAFEAATGGRSLAIELKKEPGSFQVVVDRGTWAGSGDVALRATVPLADLAKATLAIEVAGLQLTSPTGVRVEGLATESQFVGLPVPVTTTSQRVTWQAIHAESFAGRTGHAELELHGDAGVDVKVVQQTSDGIGSIGVDGVRWTPGVKDLALTVKVDDLSMQQWLELLSGGRVTGEGRLDGTVALILHLQPSLAIDLHGGQLTAAPGGVVRFLEKATAAALLRVDGPGSGAADPAARTKEDLAAALTEFVYTALDFRVEPDPASSAVTLRVHAAGTGKGMTRPIEMNVNVRGIDQAVDTALALKFGWQRMTDRIPRPHAATKTNPGKNP